MATDYAQVKLLEEDDYDGFYNEEDQYYTVRESESVSTIKPYDVASTLHLHHIKTTEHKAYFVLRVISSYLDLSTDLVCCVWFYAPDQLVPMGFLVALFAVALPSVIMVCLPGQSFGLRMLTMFRIRLGYEAVSSWQSQLETIEFCIIELIESIAQGFPSALLQVHALMYRHYLDAQSTIELLGPEYVLFMSIGISVATSSWTSARLFNTNEERNYPTLVAITLFLYYGFEKLYRLFYFSIISIFLSSGGYKNGCNPYIFNLVFLMISIITRLVVVCYSHHRVLSLTKWDWEESWDFIGRLLMSLATSHMWVGEYVLTSRLLMLEFMEGAFCFSFFLWLREVTPFETYAFNARTPMLLAIFFYTSKCGLLLVRLFYTPHCRHVLYNHAKLLAFEASMLLIVVALLWSLLILFHSATR